VTSRAVAPKGNRRTDYARRRRGWKRLARLAPLAAVLLAAPLVCPPAGKAAPREERTARLLLDGRLVRVAEIAADAASRHATIARYDGDEAFFSPLRCARATPLRRSHFPTTSAAR